MNVRISLDFTLADGVEPTSFAEALFEMLVDPGEGVSSVLTTMYDSIDNYEVDG
jgi:hypothetical protein